MNSKTLQTWSAQSSIDLQYQQDLHVHTHYAYCSKDITIDLAVEAAKHSGIENIGLVEHSGQLYTNATTYWSGEICRDPSIMRFSRDQGTDRMRAFREEIMPLASDFVKVGLEVDCAFDGSSLLLSEDASGWDFLIGAVHELPCDLTVSTGLLCKTFLDLHEIFLTSNLVQILAHPFRLFRRANLEVPTELFEPMASLLAQTKVAAEINFHTNEPGIRFFELCLNKGVLLSLGSDAHSVEEVACLEQHVEFLKQLGATKSCLFRL